MDFFDQIRFFGWVKLPPVSSSESGQRLATLLENAGIQIRTKSDMSVVSPAAYGTGVYDINDDYRTRDVYVRKSDYEDALIIHRRSEANSESPSRN